MLHANIFVPVGSERALYNIGTEIKFDAERGINFRLSTTSRSAKL